MSGCRTYFVIFILLASTILTMVPNGFVNEVEAYNTPGTGQSWVMSDLVSNSGGDVIQINPTTFRFVDSVRISKTDTIDNFQVCR